MLRDVLDQFAEGLGKLNDIDGDSRVNIDKVIKDITTSHDMGLDREIVTQILDVAGPALKRVEKARQQSLLEIRDGICDYRDPIQAILDR